MNKEKEFKCANCNGIFDKGWSDEEADKEAEDYFGKPKEDWRDGAAIVCDDCFNDMHPLKYPEIVKETKKRI